MSVFFNRIVCVFFVLAHLMPRTSYCVTARGLVIDLSDNKIHLLQQGNAAETPQAPAQVRRLDELILGANLPYEYEGDTEEVDINLAEDDIGKASLVDTDEEDDQEFSSKISEASKRIRGLGAAKDITFCNRSRHNTARGRSIDGQKAYKRDANYLKSGDALNGLSETLALEALKIVQSDENPRTIASTVCLCVALRDKHQHIKKFVFHNGCNILPEKMRDAARKYSYDVIQTERSHAEGQFIHFLLHRNQKRPGWYTHIMGMGCSKCHCAKCDCLFKIWLGKKYYAFTTAVNDSKGRPLKSEVSKIASVQSAGGGFTLKKEITIHFTTASGEEVADSNATYDNDYHWSELLQTATRQRRLGERLDCTNKPPKRRRKKEAETQK